MTRKIFFLLAVLALFVMCENPDGGVPDSYTYTVTFDKNGGTTEASPRTKTVTSPAATVDALPSQPTWANHDFTGWNTQADGGGAAFTETTPVTADITVYAQWLNVPPGSFVVTFNKNGGDTDAAPSSKIVTPPAATIDALPSQPTRANHGFTGWNTAANGTGSAFTAATVVTASITVYAQWELSQVEPPVNPPISPNSYRNLFKELGGKTDAQIDAKVQGAYNRLFNGAADQKIYYEVDSDMAYILDSGNNDVRSEGMSYGMMMCVQMNDKTRFDRLWKWAYNNMYNDRNGNNEWSGFFAWQCGTGGNKIDQKPAPDGEFYFVTALLFASARWGDGSGIYEYGRYARHILYDMIHRPRPENQTPPMFRTSNHNGSGMYMPVFQPYGNNYLFTDPSYHLPAFYDVWAVEVEEGEDYWDIWGGEAAARTDAAFWRNAATASRAFFKTTVHAATGLGPDYANFDGSPTGGEHADFRYDAWRIAMNIGMDYAWQQKDPWQVEFADRIQSFFHGKGVSSYGSLWNLNGNGPLQNGSDHSPGLVACNAVASFAASHSRRVDFINNFWDVPMTSGQYRYYDGCLYMLGMLHVSGNFKIYSPANRAKSSGITPATASFDKKAGAQADVTVTMTLNGNTLSNIKNGNATLTQSTHYTVNGSVVTIKAAYLAQQPNGTTTLTFNFSAGRERTLAITVGDSTGGGPIGGGSTEYDFSANPGITVEGNRSGITAVIENGVLKVNNTLSYQNNPSPSVVIPFDLGSATLGSFNRLEIKVKGSGDIGSKTLTAQVSSDGGATYTALGTVSTGGLGSSYATLNITIGSSGITGPIKISLSLGNTNPYILEIQSIKLLP